MKIKRRTFLKIGGAFVATIPFLNLRPEVFASKLSALDDRILIFLEMAGGNDGLNTVIPFKDSAYYNLRPNIAVPANTVLPISDALGLNPELTSLMDIWNKGKMAVVMGVGYPDQNLSHFRSTDIWQGASTEQLISTGWLGRYLGQIYPGYPLDLPDDPPSLEIKAANSLLIKGDSGYIGMAVTDPETINLIVSSQPELPDNPLPGPYAGSELDFVQQIESQAVNYSEKIHDTWQKGTNSFQYPATGLASNLSLIGRLVSGGLDTKIYTVALGGFDTHVNQLASHPGLLKTVAEAISSFIKDMENQGISEKIILMTASEFGRRVQENGSGTDHGAAAPQFVFGDHAIGGILGDQPSLTDLDQNGNLKFHTDFRQVYSSMLQQWLGLGPQETEDILGGSYAPLPLIV